MKRWLRAWLVIAVLLGLVVIVGVGALTTLAPDQIQLRINGETIAWPADAAWTQVQGMQAALAALVTAIAVPLVMVLGIGLPLLALVGAVLATLAVAALVLLIALSPLLLLLGLLARLLRGPRPVA